MRRLLISLALVFVLTWLFASASMATDEEGNEEGKPSILIEEMRHDMGEVFEREKYIHAFTVKNTGGAELVIDSVKPG